MHAYSQTLRSALPGLMMAITLALAACAPAATNIMSGGGESGHPAQISHGIIVSMRDVTLRRPSGGDVRGTILVAIGATSPDAQVGAVADRLVSTGQVVELIIQEDNAPAPISVVQTNELNFKPGERIVLTRGARARIARAGA